MRKKVLFAFVISLLAFGSCLKQPDIESPPTQAGALIYSEARMHNNYAMFCADLCYKLNILLEARIENQPLDEVLVVVSNDNDSIVRKYGMAELFKGMNITFEELNIGSWTVTFVPNISFDNTYEGSLLISTNNKLLSVVGNSWNVYNAPNLGMSYGGGGIILDKTTGVTVAHLSQDNFWIYATDFGLYNITADPNHAAPSKWSLDFYVEKSSDDYSFLGMRNSVYEMTGKAAGVVAGYESRLVFSYEIDDNIHAPSPLLYKYSDNYKRVIMYGGTEIIDAPGLPILTPDLYPTSEVVVVWNADAEGNYYYDLTYNGYTTTTRPK